MRLGYALSSEEHPPEELVRLARMAQDSGFEALWISDHFHPWNAEQGQSPFVWSVIGALSREVTIPVTTAVTCPIMRIHPAVIAQAAATSARLLGGGFVLGVGTGEALNEHILGDRWPEADVRREMLEEAVALMRELWTGEQVSFYGEHFDVVNARLYSLPASPPPVYVSGLGPASTELAARIGDGYVTTRPDREAIELFRRSGGEGKPVQASVKVCWDHDVERAVDTVHRLWPHSVFGGQLDQELALPELFEQAGSIVTRDMVRATSTPFGPDTATHVRAVLEYADAGCDEVYVGQIGPDQDAFFEAYRDEVLPAVRDALG